MGRKNRQAVHHPPHQHQHPQMQSGGFHPTVRSPTLRPEVVMPPPPPPMPDLKRMRAEAEAQRSQDEQRRANAAKERAMRIQEFAGTPTKEQNSVDRAGSSQRLSNLRSFVEEHHMSTPRQRHHHHSESDSDGSIHHTRAMTFTAPYQDESTVDFRSDTFTQPTPEMRKAMAEAVCGDDVWNEDTTVQELEREMAAYFGKEAALYVVSGTMGNLISMMVHCRVTPSEAIVGDDAHIIKFEVGGTSVLGHAQVVQVPTSADGTMPLEKIDAKIRKVKDVHFPITRVVALENTHNMLGGRVLPMDYVHRVRELCDRHGLKLHCDGARIWNAAARLGLPMATVVAPYDTVSVCLSKGLGAPVGAVIVGSKDFIDMARRVRRMVGGGLRQAGVIAAAGLHAFRYQRHLIPRDHENAQIVAECLRRLPHMKVLPVETNIVIADPGSAERRTRFIEACAAQGVRMMPMFEGTGIRFITHNGITAEMTARAVRVMGEVGQRVL
eukprot:PhM_4_TR15684/c0_g1_i4/m.903/K01620/ltaE; threonine aldolase